MREEHEAAIEEFWSKYKSDEERKQNFYQEICIEKVEGEFMVLENSCSFVLNLSYNYFFE